MQGLKDTAANIAASAVSGMEKTKATVQEKVETMTTHDPEQKEMAREKKQERITQAELDKQEAKQYRAAASRYSDSATGGQGYYSSEATGGYLTSGHDTHTHSATGDYPMGAHQTSAMTGHGTGQQYGGQEEEEGMVSTYPGGLPGDSTTGHNSRASGTGYTTGTDGTGYGTRQPYGGHVEEGTVNIYSDGLPDDSTTYHNTRAGGNAYRTGTDSTGYTTGTDGTGYGTRQPYGGQVEEGMVNMYPDRLPDDSTTDHNTRAGSNAYRTGTDGTGYTTGTDGTGYGTRQSYGEQVEEGTVNIYPDGLPDDSTTYHNTRAGGNAYRTGTDGTGYTTGTDGTGYGTRQPYGGQVEEGMVNIYPDRLPDDSTTDHNTRAGSNAYRTGTDGTGYTTGTDGTGYGTRQSYGGQVEEGMVNIYPDGLPNNSITDHNTRADGNSFRTGTD